MPRLGSTGISQTSTTSSSLVQMISYAAWIDTGVVNKPSEWHSVRNGGGAIPTVCDFNPHLEAGARFNAVILGKNVGALRMRVPGYEGHNDFTNFKPHDFLAKPGNKEVPDESYRLHTGPIIADALVDINMQQSRVVLDLSIFGFDVVAPGSILDFKDIQGDYDPCDDLPAGADPSIVEICGNPSSSEYTDFGGAGASTADQMGAMGPRTPNLYSIWV